MLRSRIGKNIDQVIQALQSGNPLSEEMRKAIVTKLRHSEEAYTRARTLIKSAEELASVGAWEQDVLKDEMMWSDETFRIFGFEPGEIEPTYDLFLDKVHPDDREKVDETYRETIEKRTPCKMTYRIQQPGEEVKYVEAHGEHSYEDGRAVRTIGTVQDVTERELDKQRLEDSLKENQTLLGEIHHRVKNNLAVVAGMLQLQWLKEDNPKFKNKLQDSANRIKTIAGIHCQLYQSDEFADVALGENIENLASDLISTMESDTEIELNTNCDTVHLHIDQTLPCSLIANEVVTNIIKHAFPDRETGKIEILLTEEEGQVKMVISDNGVGLPDDFKEKKGSLGMNLIDTLSKQLNADHKYSSSEEGTTFSIRFKKKQDKKFPA